MTRATYDRLSIVDFGRQLITTGDLDPVYIALNKCGWDQATMDRWLLAYWCFYDCGVASYLADKSEDDDFWEVMMIAAHNEEETPIGGRWRRAAERRHARGQAAVKMVKDLKGNYWNASRMLEGLRQMESPTCRDVMKWTKMHHLFGDWIGFKIADMAETVLGIPVSFEQAEVFMFKDPVKAALMVWCDAQNLPRDARPKDQAQAIRNVLDHLAKEFAGLRDPSRLGRPLGLQELETVLCKWKSHMNGHYALLNDIGEIRGHVEPWTAQSPAAFEFLQHMPDGSVIQ